MKNKTHVAIVLDTSGSMGDDMANPNKRAMTVAGFNEQIQQIRKDAADVETYASLVTFDGNVYEHFWNIPAAELKESNIDAYNPTGSTAMRDAIGYVVDKFNTTTDISDKDTAYLIIVISDGYENASTHHSAAALKEMITAAEATKRWTFTYMGCSKESLKEVTMSTGIAASNMANFDGTARGIRMAAVAAKDGLADYFHNRRQGLTKTCCYYSDTLGASADFSEEALSATVDLDCVESTMGSDAVFGTKKSVEWASKKL